jgi:hypothetical protein
MSELEAAIGEVERAERLRDLMPLVRQRFNEVFWDEEKGRYIGCIDVTGARHDYGFTYINTEALAYGLADERKARRVLSWLDGERQIDGDHARGSEIYDYVIAPRSTTIPVESAEPHWWYDIGGAISLGPGGSANYDDHLENGGIIFYTSFYDLMSRLRHASADDALERLDAMLSEFHVDQLNRDPANSRGVPWKLGIIGEFPESGMVPTFMVHGLLGAEALADGLHLRTVLPAGMKRATVTDIFFRGSSCTVNVLSNLSAPCIGASGGGYRIDLPPGCHVIVQDGLLKDIPESCALALLSAAVDLLGRPERRRP